MSDGSDDSLDKSLNGSTTDNTEFLDYQDDPSHDYTGCTTAIGPQC